MVTKLPNLNAEDFCKLLVNLNACSVARTWAENKTLAEVWETCERPDWMLWLLKRYGKVDAKVLIAIACDCAEPALAFVNKDEQRPLECMAIIRRWLKGEATADEVEIAAASISDATENAYTYNVVNSYDATAGKVAASIYSAANYSACCAVKAAVDSSETYLAGLNSYIFFYPNRAIEAVVNANSAAANAASASIYQNAHDANPDSDNYAVYIRAACFAAEAFDKASSQSLKFSADICRKYIEIEG